jgi:NAD(P)-dependent dehydrogenase (short-subunit alcohol dehydrogenase family)
VRVRHPEVDLAHLESAAQVLHAAQEWLGVPDILVNNAAYSTHGGFELLDSVTLAVPDAVKCARLPRGRKRWAGSVAASSA